jgi:hypothetical protein
LLEAPRRLAGSLAGRRRLLKFVLDHGVEPVVLGQAEQKIHTVGLAPGHEFLTREPAVRTHQNAHARPLAADVSNNGRHLFHGTGGAVDVRTPQLGGQQMAPAENVER